MGRGLGQRMACMAGSVGLGFIPVGREPQGCADDGRGGMGSVIPHGLIYTKPAGGRQQEN